MRRRLPAVLAIAAIAIGWTASRAGAQAAPPPAQASEPNSIRLTLDEAIARALRTSHRIGEGQARQDAATAAVDSRAAATLPMVSVMAGYTRTNHIVPFGIPPEKPTAIIYPDIPDN